MPLTVEQLSVQESTDRKAENGEFRLIKNSAGVYDWQGMCQKEWPKSFLEIQKAFAVFGGFQLGQPPVEGKAVPENARIMVQEDIPLLKEFRYFQVVFTLKTHG